MYYDLVASLPYLPHFERADRLPITRLRLRQRLGRLTPAHADQLLRVRSMIRWRPETWRATTDAAGARDYEALMSSPLDPTLEDYVAFRMDQQTLVAALRRKRDGAAAPESGLRWGVGPRVHDVQTRWDAPDFGLSHVYPWLPQARDLLASGDARGFERLSMNVVWRWLDRCAEWQPFGFEAVFAYAFKWDLLQAWLACDADKGKTRFKDLIDEVTRVEHH